MKLTVSREPRSLLRVTAGGHAPSFATPPWTTIGQMSRGVFLDLAGTLVQPLKPERLDESKLILGVAEAIARLSSAGFVCPVVTVQSRVAKGLWSLSDFEKWFASLATELELQGAIIVGPYVCPHRFAEPYLCKKPNTLLYDRAAFEHQMNPMDSFVIGDSPDDVRAARRLGARGCLVRTGWAADPRVVEEAAPDADIVAGSFGEAVDWIMRFPGRISCPASLKSRK
jgi:D-glycero-D-manno-heptose 1,7-bisphosphate phosphatase